MTVLVLRLAAPLQSWGDSSRFVHRNTRREPTKSGIIGLIAAAQGRRRVDAIEDLTHLIYGVRTDQPGELLRDFHTAQSSDGSSTMPLSFRYYLSDAVFVAGLEADTSLLEGIDDAVRNPVFPLYLGRRSCPPTGMLSLGLRQGSLIDVMRAEPWHASPGYQKRSRLSHVRLEFVRDALDGNESGEISRDVPVSFDPERREYLWRTVVRDSPIDMVNPYVVLGSDEPSAIRHDPMSVLGRQ